MEVLPKSNFNTRSGAFNTIQENMYPRSQENEQTTCKAKIVWYKRELQHNGIIIDVA